MRYLPHTREDLAAMLAAVGVDSLEELFRTVPAAVRLQGELNLPPPLSEWELNDHMDTLAARIAGRPEYSVFLGAGRYDHFIPASITALLGRGEFSTSYTPYQPEISQGTLQGIYEFQTLASRLLGLEVATASHYEGATALAEALLIAIKKTGRSRVAISALVHPLFREVVATYLRPTGYEIVEIPAGADGSTDPAALSDLSTVAAVAIQSPNFFGGIEPLASWAELAHGSGALLIATFTEPLAFGLFKSPGGQGADLAAGEGQSLGIRPSFGGPGLGILASTPQYLRDLPGRLVGKTVDSAGERGFVLTLAAREQHIRREKATSNICTNNGLNALAAAMYMASLGGSGVRQLAALNHDKAEYLKGKLRALGVGIPYAVSTFNEFVADFGSGFDRLYQRLLARKIVLGLPLARYYPGQEGRTLLCVTETMKKNEIDRLLTEVDQ